MEKHLVLKDKSIVFIDWANVHGWEKSLKRELDPAKIFEYLKAYEKIEDIRLYFGTDTHQKSVDFLASAEKMGYNVITKPVKYIFVAEVEGQKIYRRKCDFDMEICIDAHQALKDNFESYIFFTGDGDFEPLYKLLRVLGKQVIVVYMYGHLGREIFQLKNGTYKVSIETLERKYGSLLS
jgi:uncharacterized LabA/DUF88 family protein